MQPSKVLKTISLNILDSSTKIPGQNLFRSSRSPMFFKISFLENLAVLKRIHLCWSLFLIKMFSGL